MKKKILLAVLGFILVLGVSIGSKYFLKDNNNDATVIPPTCTTNGYTIYEENGKMKYKDFIPATGHKFNDWFVIKDAIDISCGIKEHICSVCGMKENQRFYLDINCPIILLEGDISKISKTTEATLQTEFYYNEIKFSGYSKLKYQGHSSLKYEKKNFTIKFFEDEECKTKNKVIFNDWNPEHKYILKANYVDISRSRNLICADIWSQMVSNRDNVNKRLLTTSNYGAIDGFNVAVYLNGEFIGLYTLTLHKDDDLFVMEDGKKDGLVIINKETSQEALFKKTIDWNNSSDWEVEYCGTDDDTWIKDKLNNFISFVIESSDEEFKSQINNYVDVNSLIDYMIAMYTLGLQTNYAKDFLLITYDNSKWIASLFDMENAFGIVEEKNIFSNANQFLPELVDDRWNSETGSILWDRLINIFYEEIVVRYKYLRTNVLSNENIENIVRTRIESVPLNLNKADINIYSGQPFQDVLHIEQIINYTRERLNYLDNIFNIK